MGPRTVESKERVRSFRRQALPRLIGGVRPLIGTLRALLAAPYLVGDRRGEQGALYLTTVAPAPRTDVVRSSHFVRSQEVSFCTCDCPAQSCACP